MQITTTALARSRLLACIIGTDAHRGAGESAPPLVAPIPGGVGGNAMASGRARRLALITYHIIRLALMIITHQEAGPPVVAPHGVVHRCGQGGVAAVPQPSGGHVLPARGVRHMRGAAQDLLRDRPAQAGQRQACVAAQPGEWRLSDQQRALARVALCASAAWGEL